LGHLPELTPNRVIVNAYAHNQEKSQFEASRHQGAEALPALRRSNACAMVRTALG